ncbi:MAG: hypothetical protein FJ087_04990 [Deltaproteobacteria bacterium]|nr:hypothetical protein [Deltaproteobacteria bacterium]
MSDQDRRDEAGKESAPAQGGGDQARLDDLKAKLGIARKAKPAEAAAGAPVKKPTAAEDFSFTLNQPVAVQVGEAQQEETSEIRRILSGKEKVGLKTILVFVVAGLVVAGFGLYFGKVMKERSLENYKIKEAAFILDYFETSKPGLPGIEEPSLRIIEAHAAEALAVFQALNKAADDMAAAKAEERLLGFMKACQEYRKKQAGFSFDGAFPGVIFNQEIASQVVAFITAVQRLYDETAIMALEADTYDHVGGLEEKEGLQQTFLVEPEEKDGKKTLKFSWVRADTDAPRDGANGQEFAVAPLGEQRGFWAPASSLVQFDIGPIARTKSGKYKDAIQKRVRGRLSAIKQLADQIDTYKGLKDKLEKVAKRNPMFTIF